MTLIILLAVLALQYCTNIISVLPKFNWFEQYVNMLSNFLSKPFALGNLWGIAFVVAPILIIVGIINFVLSGWIFSLIEFLFSLIILLYCLRAENLKAQLNEYFGALEADDLVKAGHAAKEFLGRSVPNDAAGMARAVTQGVFQKAIVQCFSYIFWFALFGLYGVMLYFSVRHFYLLANKSGSKLQAFADISKKAQAVLDWVPVRLAGLSYALVGHFAAGFSHWLKTLIKVKGLDVDNELAWSLGLAGLNAEINSEAKASAAENIAAINLVNNAVIVWIVVIAIFILGYWLA